MRSRTGSVLGLVSLVGVRERSHLRAYTRGVIYNEITRHGIADNRTSHSGARTAAGRFELFSVANSRVCRLSSCRFVFAVATTVAASENSSDRATPVSHRATHIRDDCCASERPANSSLAPTPPADPSWKSRSARPVQSLRFPFPGRDCRIFAGSRLFTAMARGLLSHGLPAVFFVIPAATLVNRISTGTREIYAVNKVGRARIRRRSANIKGRFEIGRVGKIPMVSMRLINTPSLGRSDREALLLFPSRLGDARRRCLRVSCISLLARPNARGSVPLLHVQESFACKIKTA